MSPPAGGQVTGHNHRAEPNGSITGGVGTHTKFPVHTVNDARGDFASTREFGGKLMSFKNIFGGGGNEAKSAEESAQKIYSQIPGVRPEDEGVDPELYEGIEKTPRDPKIVRETSPEALNIANSFLTPLFKNTQTAAAGQQKASENPETTTGMASSTMDKASEKMEVKIKDEDKPKISDEDRANLKKDNREQVKNVERNADGSVKEWPPTKE
ncbi:hypothetical protein AB0K71_26255 [Streptomyces syringium]|uniref:hypothetical protein n=2 Tax=Streptomyces syringium TaxID=76729 RepID=UPI0034460B79